MNKQILGIHHVTAIAGDPQTNINFYTGVLGLRLVKRTVNFDDPGSYHLYFGDRVGAPGTIITFFPWPRARRGMPGTAVGYWKSLFQDHHVFCEEIPARFGNAVLRFVDPDGLILELIPSANLD